jgi:hypothetical protein
MMIAFCDGVRLGENACMRGSWLASQQEMALNERGRTDGPFAVGVGIAGVLKSRLILDVVYEKDISASSRSAQRTDGPFIDRASKMMQEP